MAAERCAVAFPRETPRVPGCSRPLRHAAGRCGADAPLSDAVGSRGWGGGDDTSADKIPSSAAPLSLFSPAAPLIAPPPHPHPQLRAPRHSPLLQGSLSPQRSFQDAKSFRSVRGILAKLCLLYYLCPSMVSDPSSPGLNISFAIGKREVVQRWG